jgi:hypothetical protein
MRRRDFIWVLGTALAVLSVCYGREKRSVQSATPIWQVDLTTSGYTQWDHSVSVMRSGNAGISFVDNATVAVYFVSRKVPAELSKRGHLQESDPYHLRAVFLNAEDGNPKSTKDWPTRANETTLLVSSNGNLIVRTGETLRLYSSKFQLLAERNLPRAGGPIRRSELRVSPSGRVLFLNRPEGSTSDIEILDADSFRSLGSWKEFSLGAWYTVSDHSIAKSVPPTQTDITIQPFRAEPRVIYNGSSRCPNARGIAWAGDPVFVNNNELMAFTCEGLVLLSTEGEVLMKDKLAKGEGIEKRIASSRVGNVAAVSIMKTKGGAFDTAIRRSKTRIAVYDVTSRRPIDNIDVNPIPESTYDFAVAPDGSSIAVLVDGSVKFYKLTSENNVRSSQIR